MSMTSFLQQAAEILTVVRRVEYAVPDIIINILFSALSFYLILVVVNIVRGVNK